MRTRFQFLVVVVACILSVTMSGQTRGVRRQVSVMGTVPDIGPAARTFTIATKQVDLVTMTLDRGGFVMRNGTASDPRGATVQIPWTDIKSGDNIGALGNFVGQGAFVAASINVYFIQAVEIPTLVERPAAGRRRSLIA
jgi:hypothetical protein